RQTGRMILCGRYSVSSDAVVPDNRGGAAMVTRYLLGRGHTRIAEITGPPDFSTTTERSAGHREALAEAGIERHDGLTACGHFSRDGGYAATATLLRSAADFTAIFAAN